MSVKVLLPRHVNEAVVAGVGFRGSQVRGVLLRTDKTDGFSIDENFDHELKIGRFPPQGVAGEAGLVEPTKRRRERGRGAVSCPEALIHTLLPHLLPSSD